MPTITDGLALVERNGLVTVGVNLVAEEDGVEEPPDDTLIKRISIFIYIYVCVCVHVCILEYTQYIKIIIKERLCRRATW
jgi:hypothetical protein